MDSFGNLFSKNKQIQTFRLAVKFVYFATILQYPVVNKQKNLK